MDVLFNNSLQENLVKRIPLFRGSWLIYTTLVKAIPRKFKYCSLKENDLQLDLSDPAQFSIVKTRHGNHEIGTVNFIKKYLSPEDVFIDVGASFGYFSYITSKIVGDAGLVFAFEPNKTAFNQLLSTILRNKLFNVIPSNIALGDISQTTVSMKKSLLRQSTSSYMIEGNSVLSNSLDNFIKNISTTKKIKMIKVDVEGAELPVIKGLTDIIKTHSPFLIIEPDNNSNQRYGFQFNEVISFLKNLEYAPRFCLEPNNQGRIIPYSADIQHCSVAFSHTSLKNL